MSTTGNYVIHYIGHYSGQYAGDYAGLCSTHCEYCSYNSTSMPFVLRFDELGSSPIREQNFCLGPKENTKATLKPPPTHQKLQESFREARTVNVCVNTYLGLIRLKIVNK